jgi:transcriptional regulator GlxA family with amidase domain
VGSSRHLSRAFARTAGCTLNTYRRRLRVRDALDELPESPDLAAKAFAGGAHLLQARRAATGRTSAALLPGVLRGAGDENRTRVISLED